MAQASQVCLALPYWRALCKRRGNAVAFYARDPSSNPAGNCPRRQSMPCPCDKAFWTSVVGIIKETQGPIGSTWDGCTFGVLGDGEAPPQNNYPLQERVIGWKLAKYVFCQKLLELELLKDPGTRPCWLWYMSWVGKLGYIHLICRIWFSSPQRWPFLHFYKKCHRSGKTFNTTFTIV